MEARYLGIVCSSREIDANRFEKFETNYFLFVVKVLCCRRWYEGAISGLGGSGVCRQVAVLMGRDQASRDVIIANRKRAGRRGKSFAFQAQAESPAGCAIILWCAEGGGSQKQESPH
jgi:hypothetical protein